MKSKNHIHKLKNKMKVIKNSSRVVISKKSVKPIFVRKTFGKNNTPKNKIDGAKSKKAYSKEIVGQKEMHVASAKKISKIRKLKKNDVSLKVLTSEMVESLKKDNVFKNYVNTKIGNRANEIILSLASPMTDEALAEKLEMKINDTRRVLNMLNTDGVARYVVNKNNKGWLTFKWYIDEDNLKKMRGEVVIKTVTNNNILPDNCNDFYVCVKCYGKAKLVYPFEVGYETGFKCGECGSFFERKSKEEIEKMLF